MSATATTEQLEAELRANRAGGWIRTVQRALQQGDDHAVLYFTVFRSNPSALYVAAEYAARNGLAVLLCYSDDDPSPQSV